MALSARRRRPTETNTWPGFVDALASLLMVLIFLLLIFVLAQVFLGEALSGRDSKLEKLTGQLSQINELLALERKNSADLRDNLKSLSSDLQASVARRDEMSEAMRALSVRADKAETEVQARGEKLSRLADQIAALEALRDELQQDVAALGGQLNEKGEALLKEQELSESQRAQVALLNRQLSEIRKQLAGLEEALEVSERQNKEQNAQIKALGNRLNAALATKVQELSRYRSEFFGRLREVLGDNPDVRVVGDRFVFQSEVLFASGSAQMAEAGAKQINDLASTLKSLMTRIPKDIDWVLRVDGHTDSIPISTGRFPSNWELSTARAISVVKQMIAQGVPAERLAAAGFGEYQPLDNAKDEIANRRNRRIELKLTQR